MASVTSGIAIPGQLLGPASRYLPGPGTHIHDSKLYSSLLGMIHVSQPAKAPGPVKRLTKITSAPPTELPTISVSRSGVSEKREILPEVSNIVLCRVIRITPRQAVVAILVCGDTVLEAEWQGVIRVQDVRATEKDRVKIYESFRPGDIVRAEVVSFFCSFLLFLRCDPGIFLFVWLGLAAVCRADTPCVASRYRSEIRPTTTCQQRATSWASSWPPARPETQCFLSAGRSLWTLRLG